MKGRTVKGFGPFTKKEYAEKMREIPGRNTYFHYAKNRTTTPWINEEIMAYQQLWKRFRGKP